MNIFLTHAFFKSYKKYDLNEVPNKYNTIVHASESPFESLTERCNWLGYQIVNDESGFGKLLLHKGVCEKEIKEWMKDIQYVSLPPDGSESGSIFNYLKGYDANECIDRIVSICDVELGIVRDDSIGCSCSIM